MVLAALSADGVTEISEMHHVDRGYEDFETKLTGLGAEVRRERTGLVTVRWVGRCSSPRPRRRRWR
jgi:hypothetical protein